MTEKPVCGSESLFRLLCQANELRYKKEYRAAVALYLEAIEKIGRHADLSCVIAACYFAVAASNPNETGESFDKAILWMERAIVLEPDNPYLHVSLAQYYCLGTLEYEKAAQEYCQALSMNPNELEALVGAAALYGVPEKAVTLDEAIGWLERATQLAPGNPNYYLRLGDLYWEAERVSQAESTWLKALLCSEPLESGTTRIAEAMSQSDDR